MLVAQPEQPGQEDGTVNAAELVLPPATRLVHIGPPKTGTTSLQRALHAHRTTLGQHDVHFAGPTTHPRLAARAVAGGGPTKGERSPRPEDWSALVDEIREAHDQRVVLSSEILSNADQDAAQRVVTDLGPAPVHIVVTLRPISKIAPSQWQQALQGGGIHTPYEAWLEDMFSRRSEARLPLFWRRNEHGQLVRRWAEAAGSENVTVIVVDESDPTMLFRTFESLLGLPAESLAPVNSTANRSLTRGESEFLRLLNERFHRGSWSGPWSGGVHAKVVRQGVIRRIKAGHRPEPSEPRLGMPGWAVESAAEAGSEAARTIEALGVRVVGDLAALAKGQASTRAVEAGQCDAPSIPADVLALAALGAMKPDGKVSKGDKVAAALAALGVTFASGTGATSAGTIPLVPVDAAARAVLATIEGRRSRKAVADLPIAGNAGLAVLAAAGAGRNDEPPSTPSLGDLGPLLAALGVNRGPNKQPSATKAGPPPEPETDLRRVPATALAREFARRGREALRRRSTDEQD